MKELIHITDYANFKQKCEEFAQLCDMIKTVVDISIDNLQYFKDFKRLSDLKEERDKGVGILNRFSISEQISDLSQMEKAEGKIIADDYGVDLLQTDLCIDNEEIEEAKSQGIFEDLKFEDNKLTEEEKEEFGFEDEEEEEDMGKTKENLNNLIMKRIDDMMSRAKARKPMKGKDYDRRVKEIRSGQFKICVPAVTVMFKYLHKMFIIILETMRDSIQNKQKSSFKKFMVYASKFSILSEVIFAAFYANSEDLQYKSLDHPDWVEFFEVYSCYEPKDMKKFNKQYKTLCNFLALGSAFISKAGNSKNTFTAAIGQARYAAYYLIFKKKRIEQFDMFMSNPDIDLCLKVYNMPETDFLQKLNEMTLPKIKLHRVVYLPMIQEELTIENLKETMDDYQTYLKQAELGLEPRASFKKKNRAPEERKSIPKNGSIYENSGISNKIGEPEFSDPIEDTSDLYMTRSRQYDPEKNVKVRILSPFPFPVDWKQKTLKQNVIDKANGVVRKSMKKSKRRSTKKQTGGNSFWNWCCGCCNNQIEGRAPTSHQSLEEEEDYKNYIDIDAIMIHIHGGGFVSMSSHSHQNYTRKWATEIGIPIFSIDYRLAPENSYPKGLNDIWQAYYWILTNCIKHFGINPKKVLVSGDSAGGNYTLALTMLCIEKNFRVPDFILPLYPALHLSLQNFSPSLILSLDDFILPSGFLNLCLESYVKDADAENDHLLSPAVCPDNVLRRLPKMVVMTAGNDPLRDEQYKLVLRLRRVGVDVRCKEYINFPHGFVSFNLPVAGISECKEAINQAILYFREFIYGEGEEEEPIGLKKEELDDSGEFEGFEEESLRKRPTRNS